MTSSIITDFLPSSRGKLSVKWEQNMTESRLCKRSRIGLVNLVVRDKKMTQSENIESCGFFPLRNVLTSSDLSSERIKATQNWKFQIVCPLSLSAGADRSFRQDVCSLPQIYDILGDFDVLYRNVLPRNLVRNQSVASSQRVKLQKNSLQSNTQRNFM